MQIPLVDLKAQYTSIQAMIEIAIQRVLNNTDFILGEEVRSFEQAFADYVEIKEAIGVASGTAALLLALQACGVGRDDVVITSAHTFFATAEAISLLGATPLFVDIDPVTYTIDPNCVEDTLKQHNRIASSSGRVKALLPVHLYGQPAHMDALMALAEQYGIWVIEDACQAHGASYKGKRSGGIGHLGCFSFYPGKNLGAYGDAGMVTGNDLTLLERVRRLRNHGRSSKYEHQEVGWGERLDALQAAILNVKLSYLDTWNFARRAHASRYNTLLADTPLQTPVERPESCSVYHLYVVRSTERDALLAHLQHAGIEAGIHYPVPLHRQPAYRNCSCSQVQLPVTEQAAGEVLSLPLYPEMRNEQIDYIVEKIKEYYA